MWEKRRSSVSQTELLTRKPDETTIEYKNRLLRNKDIYGITWDEVAEWLNAELEQNYSADKYRKESYKLEQADLEEEIDGKLLELRKARVKLSDERVQVNALARNLARKEVFEEMAIAAAKEVAKNKTLVLPNKIEITEDTAKAGLLCIGDWHYGAEVDLFFNTYNPEEAVRRVNRLMVETKDIIKKNNLKDLYVINLGDMISGRIHLPLRINSRLDAVSQTIEVSELLAEFLTKLSEDVVVHYYDVEDNHSRVEPNKRDSINTESFARIIRWYLRARLNDNENINFYDSTLGDDIIVLQIFDHLIAAVHGDKDPQRGIVDRLNSYLQTHVDMIISAHMHHFSADENSNTEFYCNGSLIGQDDYANSLRLNSKPSQLLFIVTPDNVSSVIHKIKL